MLPAYQAAVLPGAAAASAVAASERVPRFAGTSPASADARSRFQPAPGDVPALAFFMGNNVRFSSWCESSSCLLRS